MVVSVGGDGSVIERDKERRLSSKVSGGPVFCWWYGGPKVRSEGQAVVRCEWFDLTVIERSEIMVLRGIPMKMRLQIC
ncbi:hypothetical protein L1887_14492 [Cichorium endivia]|nr:hypothetical protein L1887_14492 [Cichorium endivia]